MSKTKLNIHLPHDKTSEQLSFEVISQNKEASFKLLEFGLETMAKRFGLRKYILHSKDEIHAFFLCDDFSDRTANQRIDEAVKSLDLFLYDKDWIIRKIN